MSKGKHAPTTGRRRSTSSATDVRRRPRQARAVETVEAILEATHRILDASGAAGLTTSRIAEVAGVSVGSFYQYFPSKEAVIAALIEQRVGEGIDDAGRALALTNGLSLRESLRVLVAILLNGTRRRVGSYEALVHSAPSVERDGLFVARVAVWEQALGQILARHRDELRAPAREHGPFLLVRAVQGALHGLALERPEQLAEPAIAEELVELAARYLVHDGDGPPTEEP